MRAPYLILILLISSTFCAQNIFKIDQYGVLTDSVEIKALKEKYELIGTFQSVSTASDLKYARVLKENNSGLAYWGYIDLNGKETIEPKYLTISSFESGHALVKDELVALEKYECGSVNPCTRETKSYYYYFIDIKENQTSDYFDEVEMDESGKYYTGTINTTKKILDAKTLEIIIDTKGQFNISILSENGQFDYNFEVNTPNRSDYLDKKGNLVTNFKYNSIWNYKGYLVGTNYLKDGGKISTLINPQSKIPFNTSLKFENLQEFSADAERATAYTNDGKYFLINKSGHQLSPFYNNLKFIGDRLFFSNAQEIGILNNNGRVLKSFKNIYFDITTDAKMDFVILRKKDGTDDLLNIKTKKLLSFAKKIIAENVYVIKQGRVTRTNTATFFFTENEQGLRGTINDKGEELIPTKYIRLQPVGNTGYFMATSENDKTGLIDKNNNVLLPFRIKYWGNFIKLEILQDVKNTADHIQDYVFQWKKDEQIESLDYKNNNVNPIEYSVIDDLIVFTKDGKTGVLGLKGNMITADQLYNFVGYNKGLYYFVKDDGYLKAFDENNKMIFTSDYVRPNRNSEAMELLDGRLLILINQSTYYFVRPQDSTLFFQTWNFNYYSHGIGILKGQEFFDLYNRLYKIKIFYDYNPDDFK